MCKKLLESLCGKPDFPRQEPAWSSRQARFIGKPGQLVQSRRPTLGLSLIHICLSEQEIDIERKRVKAEIRECDKPKSLERKTETAVWKGSSLKNSIAGKAKGLEKIGKEALSKFREQFLTKENLFFYVTGQCGNTGLEFLKKELEKRQFFSGGALRDNMAPVPKVFFHRTGEPVVVSGEETEVSVSFDVDTSRYTGAAMCLFFDSLFTGDYCPVYQELSEKTGYIYSYGNQFERYKNVGSLQLNYEVTPGKLLKAFARTMEVCRQAKGNPGSLDYVRAIYLDNGDMALDDADEFNWNRAYDCHILDEAYPDIEAKKAAFRQVEENDMAKMAEDIFRVENMTVVIKGNKKKLPVKKIKRLMKTLNEKI